MEELLKQLIKGQAQIITRLDLIEKAQQKIQQESSEIIDGQKLLYVNQKDTDFKTKDTNVKVQFLKIAVDDMTKRLNIILEENKITNKKDVIDKVELDKWENACTNFIEARNNISSEMNEIFERVYQKAKQNKE